MIIPLHKMYTRSGDTVDVPYDALMHSPIISTVCRWLARCVSRPRRNESKTNKES